MKKMRGFTLIELMIVAAIAMIALSIVFGASSGSTQGSSSLSWGINGMTEMRCINGYSFVVDNQGNARQVMDEFGKGMRCSHS